MMISGSAVPNQVGASSRRRRKSYASIEDVLPVPPLIQVQLESYRWFCETGLRELFDEISPIVSFNKALELHFPGFGEDPNNEFGLGYRFEPPKYSEEECRDRDMTYAAPFYVTVLLYNRETDQPLVQEVYMGEFPLMTENGTFIVNGSERVVVSQLIRSPGVYFTIDPDRTTGRPLCKAKLIPSRGAWLEFETSKRDIISVKVDRKRKIPVTVLLRALGCVDDGLADSPIQEGTDEELMALFESVDNMLEHGYLESTIDKGPSKDSKTALEEFYKKMRPGDPSTFENAKSYLESLLFNPRRYDLGKVGRYKLNRRLHLDMDLSRRTLTKSDIIEIVRSVIRVNNGVEDEDDIDHLGNRRIKTVGELVQNQMRIGLLRMERVVRERMSIRDPEQITPIGLINIRPVVAILREFFGGSQLSQFMDQTNPLAELTHKRTLSALGPGGLRRERAGFDVRDVHHSHYGRICPIETPEGPNIGLIGRLALYGKINQYGFIETPYRRVLHTVPNDVKDLLGKVLGERVVDDDSGEVVAEAGTGINQALAERIAGLPLEEVRIVPIVTEEVDYLSADEEAPYIIAPANTPMGRKNQFVRERITARHNEEFLFESADNVAYMDVSPRQIVGVSAALIPFLEHDDANRALMGSNMQRQGVPLLRPEAPVVGTGMEAEAALYSGQLVISNIDGEVNSVTAREIDIQGDDGKIEQHLLKKYERSNQSTCINQRPLVEKGERVVRGQVIADASATEQGELALGQNVLVAFMSWKGGNYEDAILISEDMVRQDKYTSVHIEKHETETRDTKLGPEEITRDIPNVGDDALRNLDTEGVIYVGATVRPSDILVGKITPKGETELSPEERLLRAIFGEKAREVKDSSLRLPHGEKGKVVAVSTFSREEFRDLPTGVEKLVRVSVAQSRKITEGDKMAGRHGNKGVISQVVPVEDMPFLPDGTPIDIILNPLGVPSRMNVGQILETHLGWAADRLGFRVMSPVFDGADEGEISAELARAWLIDRAWDDLGERAWSWVKEDEVDPDEIEDDEEARRFFLQSHLLEAGMDEYDIEDLLRDRTETRRFWLRRWLEEKGFVADEILVFEDEGEAVLSHEKRAARNEKARNVCWRLWMLYQGYDTKDVHDVDLYDEAQRVMLETGEPIPTLGKMILYDGATGEPLDHPVAVGIIYMMKLSHLVEDKVHARSTGPYSLVTQQPLGGKAQFGGQRFGEMEVWALEAYGAAHTLQEMLTIKSDDVEGRVKTYEAIVKGERITDPGIPESFRVLVKELQSLGLAVEVQNERGETLQFRREETVEALPRLGFGLMASRR
ncbi:MAG: DNA-directed RNA polymerase subunit beta [Anaerolineae bacterium]|nr:DNA-directed RNA polymerase subunit beta [Anaerolineae bacterium]